MVKVNQTAKYFITHFILFLLGAHGVNIFKWLHTMISSVDPNLFGTTSNLLCASIFIFLTLKIR
jgi:hypothetical protein